MAAVSDLKLLTKGKVRDVYELDEDRLLLVTSDRISTYDSVHPTAIPDKGAVLTAISTFWFERTRALIRNHLVSVTEGVPEELCGRAMVVNRLRMLPVECVVRGYITGSGWNDYQASGTVSGIKLTAGLTESEQLPDPIFTPSTKAQSGHDQAIDFDAAARLIGDRELAERVRDTAITLYQDCAAHARGRGIILADTKFEFGLDGEGELTLGDELCTPDSSRFWPLAGYAPGHGQPSFDKQFVRDWASGSGWDHTPPAPVIPPQIVANTRAKYVEAYERLTGQPFSAWAQRTGATSSSACNGADPTRQRG